MIYGFKALLWGGLVAVAMSFGMTAMPVPTSTSTSIDVNSQYYRFGYDMGVCQTSQDYNVNCSVGDCGAQYLDSLMTDPNDDAEKADIQNDPNYSTGREQGVVDTLPEGASRSEQCINGAEGCPCEGGCC